MQYCGNCGKPLPENGICSCQTQKTQNTESENNGTQAHSFKQIVTFFVKCLKNPFTEIQEKTNQNSLSLALILFGIFSGTLFLNWFTRLLGMSGYNLSGSFVGDGILEWFLLAIGSFGFAFMANAVSVLVAKQQFDVRRIMIATGCSLVLPTAVLMGGTLLNFAGGLCNLAFMLAVLSMLLTNYTTCLKVLKTNPYATLLIHVSFAALLYSIMNWLDIATLGESGLLLNTLSSYFQW